MDIREDKKRDQTIATNTFESDYAPNQDKVILSNFTDIHQRIDTKGDIKDLPKQNINKLGAQSTETITDRLNPPENRGENRGKDSYTTGKDTRDHWTGEKNP